MWKLVTNFGGRGGFDCRKGNLLYLMVVIVLIYVADERLPAPMIECSLLRSRTPGSTLDSFSSQNVSFFLLYSSPTLLAHKDHNLLSSWEVDLWPSKHL